MQTVFTIGHMKWKDSTVPHVVMKARPYLNLLMMSMTFLSIQTTDAIVRIVVVETSFIINR